MLLQCVAVYGSVEEPEILFDSVGVLYFKQTCVGTTSSSVYGIKNISRIPLHFEWKLKKKDETILKVKPKSGIILPNEKQASLASAVIAKCCKS